MTRDAALILVMFLAACAQPQTATRAVQLPPPPPPPAPTTAWAIGQTPDAVIARFGPATFERGTSTARHLQFAYAPCILDVYFYPPQPGATPLGTYVDARSERGPPMDPVVCMSAQRERRVNPQKFLRQGDGDAALPAH